MARDNKFASYLVEKAGIPAELVEKAYQHCNEACDNTPRALASALVNNFLLPRDRVNEYLARFYAFKEFAVDVGSLGNKEIKHNHELLNKIPDELRKELLLGKIFPFSRKPAENRDSLIVLACNPTDKLIQQIPIQTVFKKIDVYWCKEQIIDDLILRISPIKNEILAMLEESQKNIIVVDDFEPELNEQALDEEINKSLLVNLFEGALIDAVRSDASDVHIIPAGNRRVDIFFRIDGKLELWLSQDNTAPEALAAVVKDRSVGVDRFERDTAQDGFAQRMIDGHLIRFRVSILPLVSPEYERRFESITIRVVDDRKVISDFRKLGFQDQAEGEFIKAINTPKGIVILTGPTGSGKSTTLMAALHHVIKPSVNVLTCEDPVEYVIRGARQLKIGHKMSFDQAMRSILRHDPDVVMVGEIRDRETADIAVKLANTGHLTFTTLHTNDAPSAITRLYKMGIEPFLLAYSINIIIAQRLVRKLCTHCRKPLGKEHWETAMRLGLSEEELQSGGIYEAVGCPKCHHGYAGRINIAEALYFYPEIRNEIVRSGTDIDEDRIRQIAEKHGMLSMRTSGLDRIRSGLTDISEVLFATSED
ncbi:MAG: GspE/PulE family protein [Candidatus Cloacimonetes bacterium]|nr:GspE/PulE family protein [Candidatus Cloacimonadota bacterium]